MAVTINGTGTITPTSAVQPAGSILQVLQTSDTTTGSFSLSDRTTFYDYTNMSVAITPASTSNKILISLMAFGEGNSPDHRFRWRIKRAISGGSTTNITAPTAGTRISCMGIATTAFHGDDNNNTPTIFGCSNYLDSPSTTSAITYTLQLNCDEASKTWYFNRSLDDVEGNNRERGIGYITVMEVSG